MIERTAARYGRQRLSRGSRRRVVVILSVVIVAAAVALALVAYQRLGTGEVKGDLGGYELVDGQTVRVTVSVTRDDLAGRYTVPGTKEVPKKARGTSNSLTRPLPLQTGHGRRLS